MDEPRRGARGAAESAHLRVRQTPLNMSKLDAKCRQAAREKAALRHGSWAAAPSRSVQRTG